MKTFFIQNPSGQLAVSKLIFGTTYLGNMHDYAPGFEQMDCYFELGGRCIDTARIYSNFEPNDKRPSEEVIGEWMHANGVRKELVLSTKGGHPAYGHMDKPRLSSAELREDLSRSLEALQTDYADIYWLHRDDERVPVGSIMETLHSFVKTGEVRFLGASNWSLKRIAEANAYAAEHGLTPFSASQIQWSYATATPTDMGDETLVCVNEEIYAAHLQNHLPIFAFEAQAKGFFSKISTMPEEALPAKVRKRFLNPTNRALNLAKADKVQTLCHKYGVTPAVISLAYITCNPVQAGAIFGCSNLAQLKENMSAMDFELSADDIAWMMKDE